MADQYIDEAYVNARLGTAYINAVQAQTGIDLTGVIETATARVQSAIRKNGYATPSTTTDETVKEAVLGALVELVANIPEIKVDVSKDHPSVQVYKDLLSEDGTLQITHEQTLSAAVGGSKFTESDPAISTSKPQRSSRDNLSGY